jgi:predicted transcriptional regulator
MKSKRNITTSLPVSLLAFLDQIAYEENRRKNDIISEAVLYWNAKRVSTVTPSTTMTLDDKAFLFKTLSNRNRREIIRFMRTNECYSVDDLATVIECAVTTTSLHVKQLCKSGILIGSKTRYQLNPRMLSFTKSVLDLGPVTSSLCKMAIAAGIPP